MVLARLLMVTSAYIIRKSYFSLAIYVLDKTLFLSTLRGMKVLTHAYIFEEKIYIQPYFFILLLQSVQFAFIAVLQKSYVSAKCKLQQLQTAKGVVYCSFSYSPRFTFLITLFVARLTKEYITDLSDNPTSFPAWMASAVVKVAERQSSNSFIWGSMLAFNIYFWMSE